MTAELCSHSHNRLSFYILLHLRSCITVKQVDGREKIFFSRLRSLFVLSALPYGEGFLTEIFVWKNGEEAVFSWKRKCLFFFNNTTWWQHRTKRRTNHQLVHIIIIVCSYWRKRKIGLRYYFIWHFHGQTGHFLVLLFRCNSLFNTICFL